MTGQRKWGLGEGKVEEEDFDGSTKHGLSQTVRVDVTASTSNGDASMRCHGGDCSGQMIQRIEITIVIP
jgi:hypothetical protein